MNRNAMLRMSILILVSLLFNCEEADIEEKFHESKKIRPQFANVTQTNDPLTGGGVFNKYVGDRIKPEIAKRWIENYQKQNPNGTRSHFFGNEIISELISQPGVVGISIRYGLNDHGEPQLLLVGISHQGSRLTGAENVGDVDASLTCPKFCPDED